MFRSLIKRSTRSLTSQRFGMRLLSNKPELILRDKSRPLRIERELPDPTKEKFKQRAQFVGFLVTMGVSLMCIFNYEKTQSPVVSNTLYHMRRSQQTRELLGENIDFDGLVPWVFGELNQVAGNVNIKFYIKGSKGVQGVVKLVADRENQQQEFLIHEWSVSVGDKKIDLLAEDGSAKTL